MNKYMYIFGTILFTVYGQLVIKWQVIEAGSLPTDPSERILFIFRLILKPWIISSLVAAFLGFLSWAVAMTKFDLSYAYPFTSLSFLLVLVFSGAFLGETISWQKLIGIGLIMAGIAVASGR